MITTADRIAAMNTKAAAAADRASRAQDHADRVAAQYPGSVIASKAADRARRMANHARRVAEMATLVSDDN